jgi:signal peptidase II
MLKWLVLALAVLLADQLTKYVVLQHFTVSRVVEVTPFFNLVLVFNPGAAFSFLSDASGWQRYFFSAIAVVASVWVVYLLRKYPQQRLFCVALSLILAGAVGNLIDRLLYGAVVDFLDFHLRGWHFPAFNVADASISCGAALLVWDGLRQHRRTPAAENK